MISVTWNKNKSIPITTYSYDDFYELLNFIYSGECKLNDENIITMVDLSEFYNIKSLQQKCDKYLSRKEYTLENVLFYLEALSNYSLPLFENTISISLKEKRINLFESEGFLEFSKKIIKKIVCFKDRVISEERLFEKVCKFLIKTFLIISTFYVYEWAENRALQKREESNNENFILNDAVRTEITEFLPYIKFKKMNLKFLHKFVVKKGFLFAYDELSEILENAKPDINVKVTNENGKLIFGMLPSDSDDTQNVRTLNNCPSTRNTKERIFWETAFKNLSTANPLKQRNGIDWYLIYSNDGYSNGHINVQHHASLYYTSHYLIAEMTDETGGFECTKNCKIEIE